LQPTISDEKIVEFNLAVWQKSSNFASLSRNRCQRRVTWYVALV